MYRYCFNVLSYYHKSFKMGRFLLSVILLYFIGPATGLAQDVTPPVLHSISISSDTLYVGDTIDLTIDITDDISGISGYGFPNPPALYTTDPLIWDTAQNKVLEHGIWYPVS